MDWFLKLVDIKTTDYPWLMRGLLIISIIGIIALLSLSFSKNDTSYTGWAIFFNVLLLGVLIFYTTTKFIRRNTIIKRNDIEALSVSSYHNRWRRAHRELGDNIISNELIDRSIIEHKNSKEFNEQFLKDKNAARERYLQTGSWK